MKVKMYRLPSPTGPYPKKAIPKGLPPDTVKAIEILERTRGRLAVCLARFECIRAIDRELWPKISCTPTQAPFIVVRGSLVANVIISLVALYDDDPDSINLSRLAKMLLREETLNTLVKHHKIASFPGVGNVNSEWVIEKTTRMQRRLRKNRLSGALSRMRLIRNKEYAHTDLNPELGQPLPSDYDVASIFAFTMNFFATLESLAFGLKASYVDIRQIPRDQAQRLVASVVPMK